MEGVKHRLNLELDLWAPCAQLYSLVRPRNPPPPGWSAKINPLVVSHETDNGKVEKLKIYGGRREGKEREAEMTSETFMYCDCLMLCDVYVMKLLCNGNLTIYDATLSDIYDVLRFVAVLCYVLSLYRIRCRGERRVWR